LIRTWSTKVFFDFILWCFEPKWVFSLVLECYIYIKRRVLIESLQQRCREFQISFARQDEPRWLISRSRGTRTTLWPNIRGLQVQADVMLWWEQKMVLLREGGPRVSAFSRQACELILQQSRVQWLCSSRIEGKDRGRPLALILRRPEVRLLEGQIALWQTVAREHRGLRLQLGPPSKLKGRARKWWTCMEDHWLFRQFVAQSRINSMKHDSLVK